ncbi:response regulator transcription factor [Pseudosulfitobacter sp. DSM 107133]|jgi:two-component system OmpR family response regulator|uniref:response regulator transcription factor n=1 Tax=Pseudosulfitobacter sp. DSM 107133 TaxID=2883100 RepID=UPI000DF29F11|nr:response regulator transcription factor [Pseudosulfitobacter sp. DSM 107133]UOA25624.1 Transcriptional regulatory protein SrrA [Pseudosulfitobacter sp. DSM 107133]
MSAQTILIVDDDAQIRDVLRIALEQAGFRTEAAGDGAEGLAKGRTGRFDLIVLDIGLPEMDGLAMCRELRTTDQTPVLFLTAREDEIDRVLAFELGGDDYVTKPFSPRELVARVRAILRRSSVVQQGTTRTRGVLEVDAARHHCAVAGVPLALTNREMALLDHLMQRPEQVASRPALTDAMYGANIHVSDRTVDSHLRNLRSKLSEAGCADAVETVHGVGVRMGPCRG